MFVADSDRNNKMNQKDILENIKKNNEKYSIIADFDILKKNVLGPKNRYCRFCGKPYPEVTFSDIAHAVPESLGNNLLFSNWECDKCNHFFGEHLEDHLNKFMLPYRIASQIFGKKNKIKYKTDEINRITVSPGIWNATIDSNNCIIKQLDEHTLQFNFIRQTYKPILVYKALVKIALTLIPEGELINLEQTIYWLKKEHPCPEDSIGSYIVMRFFPGANVFPYTKISILKRKDDTMPVPMYQMFIAFKNYYFQFCIPCYLKDKQLNGKKVDITVMPTPLDLQEGIKPSGGLIDLSSWNEIKGESVPVEMYFESSEINYM